MLAWLNNEREVAAPVGLDAPVDAPAVPAAPTTALSYPIAPEQYRDLDASTTGAQQPVDVVERTAVRPVQQLPPRTVSAGEQSFDVPLVVSVPGSLLRRIYARLGGTASRTTLLAPELQSSISSADDVMVPRGLATPYDVREPSPWYDSFVRTIA